MARDGASAAPPVASGDGAARVLVLERDAAGPQAFPASRCVCSSFVTFEFSMSFCLLRTLSGCCSSRAFLNRNRPAVVFEPPV